MKFGIDVVVEIFGDFCALLLPTAGVLGHVDENSSREYFFTPL